jgi:hypothetical protein
VIREISIFFSIKIFKENNLNMHIFDNLKFKKLEKYANYFNAKEDIYNTKL